MENKLTIKKITLIGVMAALVFVASQIQIRIPLGGSETRIHIGNGFCLLCGLILGPVTGGLAAGFGSALFDLFNPVYLPSAPFTFAFKFLMAFICGKIAYSHGAKAENLNKNIIVIFLFKIEYFTTSRSNCKRIAKTRSFNNKCYRRCNNCSSFSTSITTNIKKGFKIDENFSSKWLLLCWKLCFKS